MVINYLEMKRVANELIEFIKKYSKINLRC